MPTVYILINLGLVLAIPLLFRRSFRVTCGLLSGLVLLSSSLFHLLYGEGHITDYEQYSLEWWTNTYEVTVQLTYLVLFVVFSWSQGRVTLLFPVNLTYLGAGWAYFWALAPTTDATIGYNSIGVLLGSMWTVERVTKQVLDPLVANDVSEEEGKPLTYAVNTQEP